MKTALQVMGWINIILWSLTILLTIDTIDTNTFLGSAYIIATGVAMVKASKLIKK